MTSSWHLTAQAQRYLEQLCVEIPNRRVGSEGNRAAPISSLNRDFFRLPNRVPGVRLHRLGAGRRAPHRRRRGVRGIPQPYSLGCDVSAPLAVVSTTDELEAAEIAGALVLLRGEIAKEQLMP